MNTADWLRLQQPYRKERATTPELWEASIVRVASVLDAVARCQHLFVRRDGVSWCWRCGSNQWCICGHVRERHMTEDGRIAVCWAGKDDGSPGPCPCNEWRRRT